MSTSRVDVTTEIAAVSVGETGTYCEEDGQDETDELKRIITYGWERVLRRRMPTPR